MALGKEGFALILGIVALMVGITFLALSIPYADVLALTVRLCGLYGYLTLSIAAMMTPFVREAMKIFGRSFVSVHHIFATIGMVLITVHPVAYAIQTMDALVFLPSFESWYLFWSLAGRPALIILYIALAAVLLRKKIQKYWRIFHALTNIALFFGMVHANLIGTDFQNIAIKALFNSLFIGIILAFVLKRLQQYRVKKMLKR